MRARQWVAIAAFAAVVPVWAALLWGARGPSYLWFNMDPSYAYLLNSLRVAEGHSPTHTDHPGTPVQVAGAGVILAVHGIAPGGRPLRGAGRGGGAGAARAGGVPGAAGGCGDGDHRRHGRFHQAALRTAADCSAGGARRVAGAAALPGLGGPDAGAVGDPDRGGTAADGALDHENRYPPGALRPRGAGDDRSVGLRETARGRGLRAA